MGLISITPREYDVLIRLNQTNIRIARELGLKEQSVKQIIYNLCDKLKVHSRAALVVRALKIGLIELDAYKL